MKACDAYKDWIYIEANKPIDANLIDKGWVKKSNLDYYGLWGEIHSETEDLYFLGLYGASEIEIKKENVEPFNTAD